MKKFVSLMLICIFAIGMLSVAAFADDCQHEWAESDTIDGVTTYICALCGDLKTETAPAPETPVAPCEHSWEDNNILVHGNCGVDGVVDQLCVLCGEHQRVTTPATGDHDWDRDEKAATCEGAGSYSQVCKVCGKTEAGAISALGHTEEIIPGYPASCTRAGLTDGVKCSVCGEILVEQEPIPAVGVHMWDEGVVTTEPTCTEEGEMTFTCTVCSVPKTEPIEATGHTAVVVPAVDPVCGKPGLTEGSKCSVCGEVLVPQVEVPALEHKWDDGVVTVKPTTKSTGVRTYTCELCGETETETVPKLPASDKTQSPKTGSSYIYMMFAVLALCSGVVAVTTVSKKHSKN